MIHNSYKIIWDKSVSTTFSWAYPLQNLHQSWTSILDNILGHSRKILTQNASPNIHLLSKIVIKSIVLLWAWLGWVRLVWVKFVLWTCRIKLDLGNLVLVHIVRILCTIHWRPCVWWMWPWARSDLNKQFAECSHSYSGLEQGEPKAIKVFC